MGSSSTPRLLALVVALSMLAMACGQKDGAHDVAFTGADGGFGQDDTGSGDPGATDPSGTDADPGDPGPQDDGQFGDAGGEGQSSDGPTGGTRQNGGTGQTTPGGQPGGQQPSNVQPGDTTGISETTIKIGLHAPLTGAAPVPQTSFATGKDLYWRHIGKVHGRTVEVFLVNDEYNPSRATAVCNDLIQREKVYVLIGGAGTDQISACARTAAQQGVPYLSAGVDETQVATLSNYFALSMTYLQQAPLLIQWVKRHSPPPNGKFAILRDRTPGFNAVVGLVKQLAEAEGWEVPVRQAQNAASDAQWLALNEIKVAFPMMTPSTFLQVVRSPGGTIDQWAGIGITMGINTVANTACAANPGFDGAMFFSPVPGLNVIDQVDPEFRRAGGRDDIELLLYGVAKSVHEVFKKMSPDDLSRQRFIRTLESNVLESGLYPVLRHNQSDHMNAQGVHVLRANCDTRTYDTPPDGLHRTSF